MIFSDDISPEVIFSQYPGCSCQSSCSDTDSCTCLQLSQGRNYSSGSANLIQLQRASTISTQKPVYECNSNCGCSPAVCANRVVQLRLGDFNGLDIFYSGVKGLGVRASRDFVAGDFVAIYKGLYIKHETSAVVCAEQLAKRGHVYVLVVREFAKNEDLPVFTTAVDGTCGEDIEAPLPTTSLINHSCEPNLTVIPVRVDSLLPYLAFFALKRVSTGQELSYDYGERSFDEASKSDKICLCGAANCRGFLPNHDRG